MPGVDGVAHGPGSLRSISRSLNMATLLPVLVLLIGSLSDLPLTDLPLPSDKSREPLPIFTSEPPVKLVLSSIPDIPNEICWKVSSLLVSFSATLIAPASSWGKVTGISASRIEGNRHSEVLRTIILEAEPSGTPLSTKTVDCKAGAELLDADSEFGAEAEEESARYPEQHGCTFDYKTMGREAIAKANPLVKAEKLDKI
nr:zinc finger A20 and AN1 domain-containing stress-associated protein 4-like [Ipomoea batatas]GMD86202.1 zinc finger A20 and AN1 domain-containing stress-associated protein 4-like [Ipomoea batatas]